MYIPILSFFLLLKIKNQVQFKIINWNFSLKLFKKLLFFYEIANSTAKER